MVDEEGKVVLSWPERLLVRVSILCLRGVSLLRELRGNCPACGEGPVHRKGVLSSCRAEGCDWDSTQETPW